MTINVKSELDYNRKHESERQLFIIEQYINSATSDAVSALCDIGVAMNEDKEKGLYEYIKEFVEETLMYEEYYEAYNYVEEFYGEESA